MDISLEEALRIYDHYGIDKACLVSFKSVFADFLAGNRQHYADCQRAADRVVPVAFFDAGWGPATVTGIREAAEAGYKMVKLGLQAGDSYRLQRIILPFLEIAHEHGLVVLADCGHSTQDLFPFAARFAEIPFLILLNGPYTRELYSPALQLPNAYLVAGAALDIPDALRAGVDYLGADKIVFGTGFPDLDPAHVLGRTMESELSDEQREAIFSGNLLRIFEGRR